MITQKITYHPDTLIMHEFFEYNDEQLVTYERYNINEELEYYKSNIMECHYLNGKEHGLCKIWFANGQLSYEINYHNGLRHGTFKEWYSTGLLLFEENYINGVLQ